MRGMPSWVSMSLAQREAADMIIHKMQRILAGDPNVADHWEDVKGYADCALRSMVAESNHKVLPMGSTGDD